MAQDPRIAALQAMQATQQTRMPQQRMPMQPQMPMEPQPTIQDQVGPEDMSDEEMLNNVQNQMGGPEDRVTGEDMEADKMAVEAAPTDGNISAFIDAWGEQNLPDSMKNPDADGDDYAMGD